MTLTPSPKGGGVSVCVKGSVSDVYGQQHGRRAGQLSGEDSFADGDHDGRCQKGADHRDGGQLQALPEIPVVRRHGVAPVDMATGLTVMFDIVQARAEDMDAKKGDVVRRRPARVVKARGDQPVNGRIRISTRRFIALPSGVALDATGLRELLPAT